ncbi:DUF5928 domain-containing protein [Oceanomicrobium pacificus]|uniref:Peptide O-xylosyltransferase n=1 Tax=Oceanomicrobium pacificus TaxID=2692916 RepID=A0A6B0TZN9_9RHOB|nr:DUF5928 domain-containing protein [Oceanomicrobium pacificus]MXU66473.1 glycosyl transferase [Oceanomicrobium pacificus]
MAKIAYLLLCHKDPERVAETARTLVSRGDCLTVHFDASASAADYTVLTGALADHPQIAFAPRVKCGWGQWSLVQATLNMIETARARFPDATHFYMMSGDCLPIKSAAAIHARLDAWDGDYIDHHDFFDSDWIKVGLKEDRIVYRHWFNERDRKPLFYAALNLQKKLGLKRKLPDGLRIMVGSQWWCLRHGTIDRVLDLIANRPDIPRFFRSTWIPDETFFQTLVLEVTPRAEIANRTLTFLLFTDYGLPVVFHDDHADLLEAQDWLFARKVSPNAARLRQRLLDLFDSDAPAGPLEDTAPRLFAFLSGRGREGRRFAHRFWETGNSVGRGHELLVVVCKKWHVAKRFSDRVAAELGIVPQGFLFDESDVALPDLGGIENSREKRTRHRRAFLHLLFEACDTDRMMICLDPSQTEVVADIARDDCALSVLQIDCDIDADYLRGHAERVGLAGGDVPVDGSFGLISALDRQFRDEQEALRDLDLPRFYRLRERDSDETNTHAAAAFLRIPDDRATGIAERRGLFD